VGIALYFVFRGLERVIFAYLGQINRELLQLSIRERKNRSSCCFTFECKKCKLHPKIQCKLPSGIYKQAWLRFFGTVIGVLSFILILDRNVVMFGLLIFIDSIGIGVLSLWQHRDAPNTQSELIKMESAEEIHTTDGYEEWLKNMRKYVAESQEKVREDKRENTENLQRSLQRPLLKFL